MKATKPQQQALIVLLNRMYGEIRAMEEEWDLRVDAGDFRPRIDYFHDAVRALTSGGRSKRLTVEFLAYDMGMLRHIQANPMAKPKGTKNTGAQGTNVIVRPQKPEGFGKGENAEAKRALAEMYKNYAVLFAALLAESADRNFYARTEERNAEVEDLATLEQAVKDASRQRDVEINLEALADRHIDDPDRMEKILAAAPANKKKRMAASEALRFFKDMMQKADKEIKAIDQAHFAFAAGQLAVYENAREVVKKMATQGMNVVGSFVESAVQEAARKGGRGF